MNRHKLDELYNLGSAVDCAMPLHDIANQIIHSYVFEPLFDEHNSLSAILFVSDKFRTEYLAELELTTVIRLFDEVATNDPSKIHSTWNDKKQDYDVWVGPTLQIPTDDS